MDRVCLRGVEPVHYALSGLSETGCVKGRPVSEHVAGEEREKSRSLEYAMTDSARQPLKILLITNHRRFKIHFRAYPWARELARRGHEVDVLCHANTERWRTRIEEVDGFRVVENPDLLLGALRQGWDPYCAWRRRRFLFREEKRYDLIHCLDTRPTVILPGLAYARRMGIPIVSDWIDWWGRGGLIDDRRPWWYRILFAGVETWFEEHFRARLDGLTAISQALLERAVELGCPRDRCTVIHGGADLEVFAEIPSRRAAKEGLDIAQEAPVLCFSGLDVLIDLPLALACFRLVRERIPECVMLLVGPSPAQVKNLLGHTSSSEGIVTTGPVGFAELPRYLAAADVFLMPYADKVSNVGRWPNKVGDYLSVGRPIVSNRVGEVGPLFDEYEIGCLAAATAEAMSEAALELLENPERARAMGVEGRRVAESVLSWARQVMELENWYYEILAMPRRVGPQ